MVPINPNRSRKIKWKVYWMFYMFYCHLDSYPLDLVALYVSFSWWWFQIFFMFTPKMREMIQFDERIFQMGWFNHQLVYWLFTSMVYKHKHQPNVGSFQRNHPTGSIGSSCWYKDPRIAHEVAEVTAGVDICARVCHPTFNDRNPNGILKKLV